MEDQYQEHARFMARVEAIVGGLVAAYIVAVVAILWSVLG